MSRVAVRNFSVSDYQGEVQVQMAEGTNFSAFTILNSEEAVKLGMGLIQAAESARQWKPAAVKPE